MFTRYGDDMRLDDWVRENQKHYLGCIFAIVAEWVRRGKPKGQQGNHDFREWEGAMDYIVHDLMGCAHLMDGHDVAKKRMHSKQVSFVRQLCLVAPKGEWVSASTVHTIANTNEVIIPGLRDQWDERQGPKSVGMTLNNAFRELSGNVDAREVEMEGFVLNRVSRDEPELLPGELQREMLVGYGTTHARWWYKFEFDWLS